MSIVFTNNSSTTLASAILYTDVSFTVATGTGSTFPAISGGDVAYLTLTDGSTVEIVKVTGRSGDIFTCVRGQDGTSAVPWASGTTVQLRPTAAALSGMVQKANNLSDLTNAGNARTNLGVAIGTNVQAWDADLDAIAALTGTGILRKSGVATWILDSVAGTVTSIDVSGGTTGLTTTGGPVTASGTITLAGTLSISNGGTGATTAGAARTGLGATTAGSNLFTLTNPSAISFLRVNADNTISALDGPTFRTAIGAGTSSTTGTVTSVAATVPSFLSVSGSPITSSGTLAISLSGTALPVANGGTGLTSYTANGVVYASASGTLATGTALTFDGTNINVTNGVLTSQSATGGTGYVGAIGTGMRLVNLHASSDIDLIGNGGINLSTAGNYPFKFSIAGSEQMRLTSTGLGIGTSSPSSIFNIKTSNGQFLVQNGASAAQMRISAFNNAGNANAALIFEGYSSEYGRFDTSGNLGLGVTPSAWYSSYGTKAFQFAASGVLAGLDVSSSDRRVYLMNNAFINSGGTQTYINAGAATQYQQNAGQHQWFNAPSGTAGNPITFTQAMTLTAAGNLGIGSTGPVSKLEVSNSGVAGLIIGYNNTSNNYYDADTHYFRKGNSSTNQMTLDASGNLLLGTTSGAGKLTVTAPASQIYAAFDAVTDGYAYQSFKYSGSEIGEIGQGSGIISGGASTNFGIRATNSLLFATGGGTERARIDSSGNLLVGTTGKVNVASRIGSHVAAGNIALETNSTTTAAYYPAIFYNNTATAGYISVSGTTTTYATTSDYRLKENIIDAVPASDLIDAIKVRQYDWKSDGSHQRYGFVAQELLAVAPEAVHQPADSEEMMAVDYSKLVPMLVKEIQSLRKRLAAAGI